MPSRTRKARLLGLAFGAAALPGLVLVTAGNAIAAPGSPSGARPTPVPASLRTVDKAGSLAPSLRGAKGTVTVSVALSQKPVGATVAEDSLRTGTLPAKSMQQSQTKAVKAQQDRVIGQARTLGAKALGRANRAANVVAMSIPASKLTDLTKIAGVVSVKPVARYEVQQDPGGSGSLAQAADYLQVNPVRNQGFDGTGVKIGVLDSGVDFTHEYLGGPGTVEAYDTCFAQNAVAPSGICADFFGPNAPKVKGGTDFVGEKWNGAANTAAAGAGPEPDRLRGPRHPRLRHRRRPQRRRHPQGHRPGRRPVRGEGLLLGLHRLQRRGDPRGHRLGARPQRRRRHLRRRSTSSTCPSAARTARSRTTRPSRSTTRCAPASSR